MFNLLVLSLTCSFLFSFESIIKEVEYTPLTAKQIKRLEKFDAYAIYPKIKATKFADLGVAYGLQFLENIESKPQDQQIKCLDNAESFFSIGYNGIRYQDTTTTEPYIIGHYPMSMYLTTWTRYLRLKYVPSNIVTCSLFLESYDPLKTLSDETLQFLPQELTNYLPTLLYQSYQATGSPIILGRLLSTSEKPLFNTILSRMSRMDNELFETNMDVLLQRPYLYNKEFAMNMDRLLQRPYLHNYFTEYDDPSSIISLLSNCILKQYNPKDTYSEAFNDLLKIFENSTYESHSNDVKNALTQWKFYSALNNKQYHTVLDVLLPFSAFKIELPIEELKEHDSFFAEQLHKHFVNNNPSEFLNILKHYHSFDYDIESLRHYINLCMGKSNSQVLKEIIEKPTLLTLIRAIDKITKEKNNSQLENVIPSILEYFKKLSFNELVRTSYYLESLFNLKSSLSDQSIHAYYGQFFTLLLKRAFEEKIMVDPAQLESWYVNAASHLLKIQKLSSHNVDFHRSSIIFGTLRHDSKLLELEGRHHFNLLLREPATIEERAQSIFQSYVTAQQYNSTQFDEYLHQKIGVEDIHAKFMYIMARLYDLQQKYSPMDTSTNIIQDFLNPLKDLSVKIKNQIKSAKTKIKVELTEDILSTLLIEGYFANKRKEFLPLIKEFVLQKLDFARATASFVHTINALTSDEAEKQLLFLEETGILDELRSMQDDANGLIFAQIMAIKLQKHILEGATDRNALCEKLKKFIEEQKGKNLPPVVDEKLIEFGKICAKESFMDDILHDHDQATSTLLMIIHDAKDDFVNVKVNGEIINDSLNTLEQTYPEECSAFIHNVINRSKENPQMKLVGAVIASTIEDCPSAFDGCVDVLCKDYNQLLAENLLKLLVKPSGTMLNKQRFEQCIEEQLMAWTKNFQSMKPEDQAYLLHFLNNVADTCNSPLLKLTVFDLHACFQKAHALRFDDLPRCEDSLLSLVEQMKRDIKNSDSYSQWHDILDKYKSYNFFARSRQFIDRELLPLYHLIYAHILYLATKMNYAKLLPGQTELQGLLQQLKLAEGYINKYLESKCLNENQKRNYKILKNSILAYELHLKFRHNPQGFINDMIQKCHETMENPHKLEIEETIRTQLSMAIMEGTTQDLISFIENKNDRSEDENMIAAYACLMSACFTDDFNKEHYADKCLEFINAVKELNVITYTILYNVYRGNVCKKFKDDKKAAATLAAIVDMIVAQYNKIYLEDNIRWSEVEKSMKEKIHKGVSQIAYILAKIYHTHKDNRQAKHFIEVAYDLESSFQKMDDIKYDPIRLEAIIKFKSLLNKETKKH